MKTPMQYGRCLEKQPPGSEVWIEGTPGHPLLSPLGLRRGRRVRVIMRQPLGGPLIVEVAGRRVAICKEIARQIRVSTFGGATHEVAGT